MSYVQIGKALTVLDFSSRVFLRDDTYTVYTITKTAAMFAWDMSATFVRLSQDSRKLPGATEYPCGKFSSESVTVLIDRKAVRPQLTQPFTTTHPPFVFSSQATQLSLGHISI